MKGLIFRVTQKEGLRISLILHARFSRRSALKCSNILVNEQ